MPPVLIEVQNTVDKSFIRRVIKYCGYLCDEYDVEPVVVIFSIHPIPSHIHNTFMDTDTASYMKILPSRHWAKVVYFLDPKIIEESLAETPLPPLVAIEYVFSKQQQSLFGLEKKDDPIVKMLYALSKKALEDQISTDKKTVDALLDVCNNTGNQFKRMIEAIEHDGQDMKRIKKYALDGARSTSSCIEKYSQQGSSDYQAQEILKEIPITEVKEDTQWCREFVEKCKKEKRKVSWKTCYEDGFERGYFKPYKSYQSLKIMYHKWAKNQNEES